MIEGNATVNYSDLVELGFRKINITDKIHEKQYGYPYYVMFYGLDDDQVTLEWSPVDRKCNLYLNAHTYQTGLSLEEVKEIITHLTDEV